MNPDNSDLYEAVPLQCYACAARDAEGRRASTVKDQYADSAFDGLYFAVQERRVTDG